MNTPDHSRAASPFLFRYGIEMLAVATVLFILQTGLIPFDFALRAGGRYADCSTGCSAWRKDVSARCLETV